MSDLAAAIFLGTVVALLVSFTSFVRSHNLKPTLRELPVATGSFIDSVRNITSKNAPWWIIEVAKRTDARVFRVRFPQLQPFVFVCEAEAARRLLLATCGDVVKPGIYKAFTGLTKGVPSMFTLQTGSAAHTHARKGVAPAFSSRRVSEAVIRSPRCHAKLIELEALLKRRPVFDPARLMCELTVDMIGQIGLGGFNFGTLSATIKAEGSPPNSVGHDLLRDLPAALTEFFLKRPGNPFRAFYAALLPEAREAARARDRLMRLSQSILDDFRTRRAASRDEKMFASSILGHLVDNPHYANDLARCADVLTFLVAGHDTTGYTLAFTLYELAKHPGIQDELRVELNASSSSASSGADPEVFGEASPLLSRVIKESMRLWPVAAQGSIREPLTDVPIGDSGTVIPKGSTCCIPFLAVSRLANVTAPDTFLPDRWLEPKDAAARAELDELKTSFFPFSLGRRNCVGQAVAQAEIRLVLARLVRKFRFEVDKLPAIDYALTLKPAGGLLRAVAVSEA